MAAAGEVVLEAVRANEEHAKNVTDRNLIEG